MLSQYLVWTVSSFIKHMLVCNNPLGYIFTEEYETLSQWFHRSCTANFEFSIRPCSYICKILYQNEVLLWLVPTIRLVLTKHQAEITATFFLIHPTLWIVGRIHAWLLNILKWVSRVIWWYLEIEEWIGLCENQEFIL